MHGALNGTAGVSFVFLAGGSDLTRGVLGAAGFIVLAALNLGLVFYDRRLLREPMGALLEEDEPPAAPAEEGAERPQEG